MKKFRFFLLTFGMFFGSHFSNAQLESVIPNFTASEFNGKVHLNWSILQGNTCNGIEILHSTDSVNFSMIGSIEGICGGSEEIYYYDFTHDHPTKNVKNYYRLSLGGLGFSWIISLLIIEPGENNYRLGPNPLSNSSLLYLSNDNHALLTLRVFTLSGTQIMERTTTGPTFALNSDDFGVGKYLFAVQNEVSESTIRGSFLVE